MIRESERFNTNDPNLCAALRWKGQFILAESDPSVPACNDGLFWCLHTQTCIGPDGEVAEPVVAGHDGAVANIEPDSVIVADDLVTRARQTDARITFVEDAALLEDVGGVGALLRYRIQPQTTASAPQPQHS